MLVLIHLLYATNIVGGEVWSLETIPFHYLVAVNIIGRCNQSNCQTLMYAELQWLRKINTTWCQTIYVKASIPIQQCQLPHQIRKRVFYKIILIIMLTTCSNNLYVPLGLYSLISCQRFYSLFTLIYVLIRRCILFWHSFRENSIFFLIQNLTFHFYHLNDWCMFMKS